MRSFLRLISFGFLVVVLTSTSSNAQDADEIFDKLPEDVRKLLSEDSAPPADFGCKASIMLYQEILEKPESEAARVFRFIFKQSEQAPE